jgi:hypothetical protein
MCQNYTLVDRSDLFKTGNLVGWNGEGSDWCSSLQGKKIDGGYSELAGTLFVSVRIDDLGNFWNN